MDKSIHISMLLEIYGKILTSKQFDVIDLYYNQNLSLSEIAEEINITRQGVRKNLIDAENKLFDFEEKLQLLKQQLDRNEKILKIIETIDDENLKAKLKDLM